MASGVILAAVLLLVSGEIRPTLSQTSPSLQNVTLTTGKDATFDCGSYNESVHYWVKYTPPPSQRTVIYNTSKSGDLDQNKYSVENGSTILTVKAVRTEDGLTYCCGLPSTVEYCGNLVVIGTITPSAALLESQQKSSMYGFSIGDIVNLTCLLQYGSPPTDLNSRFPLSGEQDPRLSIFIGETDLTASSPGEIQIGTEIKSKFVFVNRTIESGDIEQQLKCGVRSTSPVIQLFQSQPLYIRAPPSDLRIYPNDTIDIKVGDQLTCYANGYPLPTVMWINNAHPFDTLGKTNNSNNSIVTVTTPGKHTWNCSAKNQLSTAPINKTITFDVSETNNGSQVPSTSPVSETNNGSQVPSTSSVSASISGSQVPSTTPAFAQNETSTGTSKSTELTLNWLLATLLLLMVSLTTIDGLETASRN